jgi:hypothetical protein
MKMNLISGKIEPQGDKYGIENLTKIVLACEHIKALFQKLQAEKVEQKGFWHKVGLFFKRLFGSYSDIEALTSDVTQILANKEQILREIEDLTPAEVFLIADKVVRIFGGNLDDVKDRIVIILPKWLQGWEMFLK